MEDYLKLLVEINEKIECIRYKDPDPHEPKRKRLKTENYLEMSLNGSYCEQFRDILKAVSPPISIKSQQFKKPESVIYKKEKEADNCTLIPPALFRKTGSKYHVDFSLLPRFSHEPRLNPYVLSVVPSLRTLAAVSLLHVAVTLGNMKSVRYLIELGVGVDSLYEGITPLFRALALKQTEIAFLFINKGADISFVDDNGDSLLHKSAATGNFEVILYLLGKGVIPNANRDLETPLYKALEINDQFIANYLLKHTLRTRSEYLVTLCELYIDEYLTLVEGPNKNYQLAEEAYILLLAIIRNKSSVFQRLLQLDINVTYEWLTISLNILIVKENLEFFKLLVFRFRHYLRFQNYHPNLNSLIVAIVKQKKEFVESYIQSLPNNFLWHDWSPLKFAIMKGNLDIIKLIVKYKLYKPLNSFEDDPINLAVWMGDIMTVKYIVNHFSTNDKVLISENTLNIAIRSSNLETTKFLVLAGAKLNPDISSPAKDCNYRLGKDFPISVASDLGFIDLTKLLVDLGANINYTCCFTPLSRAVNNKNFQIIKLLIDNGARVCVTTYCQHSPLHIAVRLEDLDILKVLFNSPGFHEEIDWKKLLTIAVEYGNIPVLEFILTLALEKKGHQEIWSSSELVSKSINKKNIEVMKCLLEKGANVKICDETGKMPLNIAICSDVPDVDIVKLLLNSGAEINPPDVSSSEKPLTLAIKKKHFLIVKLLVESGAEVSSDNNLLLLAIEGGSPSIVKYLLDSCPNISLGDAPNSVLIHAIRHNQPNVLKVLLDHKRPDGYEPLFVSAIEKKNAELVDVLIKAGIDPRGFLRHAINSEEYGIMKIIVSSLLKNGHLTCWDASWYNRQGNTLLHYAAANGDFDTAEKLIEIGISPNAKNKSSLTPIYKAAENGHIRMVRYLREKGGDIFITTSTKKTLLHLAAANGHFRAVKILLEEGIPANARDGNGDTPASKAKQFRIRSYLKNQRSQKFW